MSTLDGDGSQFQALKVQREDINILLLGETGVGKSTFINAIANYLDYETFEKAEKQKVCCLVPTKFVVTDEHFKQKTVSIGQDNNENTSISSSATQTTRSYVFDLQKYQRRLRLIDTPGIGDTRGIQADADNLENILSYIGQMEYLHAICFLLKPNNSRLTVMFEYCIKQLLSRLEKSASRNIIFVFTNSRSTFYKPGDTTSAIMKILDGIRRNPPNVNINFGKDNVFCLDNESFRYMVAINDGITLGNKKSFAESWAHSAEECHRMIRYVIGEGTLKMAPHRVKNTMSVNEARRIILQLSRPLAEIADTINDNINVLQRHTKTISQDNLSVESLKSKLYVPVVNLRHKELKQPTTVCTNVSCSEIYMVGDRKKYHYKQRCHDPCYLTNVPREMIGDPALKSCAAMGTGGKCKECPCDFSAHMHIYYVTETYEDKIHNEGVKDQITDREGAIKSTRQLMQTIETRVKAYEGEKAIIVKSMAKFAHFLQHNAIAPYNDAYKAYILYLIDRENSLGADCDQGMRKSLEDLLKQYEQEREILEDALKMSTADSSLGKVTADSIFKTVKDLFSLQYTGKDIKEMHTKQKKNETNEFKDTEIVLKKKQLSQLVSDSEDDGDRRDNQKGRGRGRGRGGNRGRGGYQQQNYNNNQFKHGGNPGYKQNNYHQNNQRGGHFVPNIYPNPNMIRQPQQFQNQFGNFGQQNHPNRGFQHGGFGNRGEQPGRPQPNKNLVEPDDQLMQDLQEFQRQKIKEKYQQGYQHNHNPHNPFENRPNHYKESDNPFEELYQPKQNFEQQKRNNYGNQTDHNKQQYYGNPPPERINPFAERHPPKREFEQPQQQKQNNYGSNYEDVNSHREKSLWELLDKIANEKTQQRKPFEQSREYPRQTSDYREQYESPKPNSEELISELLEKYKKKDTADDMMQRQFAEMNVSSSSKKDDRYEAYEKNTFKAKDDDDVSPDFMTFLQSNGLDDLCKQGKYRHYYDDSDSDNESKKKGLFSSVKNMFAYK